MSLSPTDPSWWTVSRKAVREARAFGLSARGSLRPPFEARRRFRFSSRAANWPAGTYRADSGKVEWHQSWWPTGIGDWFIRFNTADLEKNGLTKNCGIHYTDDPDYLDGYGKSGVECATNGCIRADDVLGYMIALIELVYNVILSYMQVV
jgi:L,D-transpeptidase catalytic domain